jgi:hypothetical protein
VNQKVGAVAAECNSTFRQTQLALNTHACGTSHAPKSLG